MISNSTPISLYLENDLIQPELQLLEIEVLSILGSHILGSLSVVVSFGLIGVPVVAQLQLFWRPLGRRLT